MENQAPITFKYDSNNKSITGCWAEQTANGKITGVVNDGAFSMGSKSLSFTYRDFLRKADGKATFTLSNTTQGLTLLGNWSQAGSSGSWTMVRDPIRKALNCGADHE